MKVKIIKGIFFHIDFIDFIGEINRYDNPLGPNETHYFGVRLHEFGVKIVKGNYKELDTERNQLIRMVNLSSTDNT